MKVWKSLLELESLFDIDDMKKGEKAFVNIIVPVDNDAGLFLTITEYCLQEGFHVVSIEETECWGDELIVGDNLSRLQGIANIALTTGEIQLDTVFHTWDNQG